LEFFNSLPEKQGWTLLQFNFTVGVRGSISTLDRTAPPGFSDVYNSAFERERESERERVCVCVCERERERDAGESLRRE
jgi:hypothetical protein